MCDDPERRRRSPDPGRQARSRDRVADAQARQPVGLGERAQQDDVRVVGEAPRARRRPAGRGRTRRRPRRARRGRRSARPSRNVASSSARTAGPVGLFGVQTSTTLVRGVTAAAIASRSSRPSSPTGTGTPTAAGERDRDRVRLERAPRQDDLVARLADRGQHVPEHGDRSAARDDTLRRDAEASPRSRRRARSRTCRGSGSRLRPRPRSPRAPMATAGTGSRSTRACRPPIRPGHGPPARTAERRRGPGEAGRGSRAQHAIPRWRRRIETDRSNDAIRVRTTNQPSGKTRSARHDADRRGTNSRGEASTGGRIGAWPS